MRTCVRCGVFHKVPQCDAVPVAFWHARIPFAQRDGGQERGVVWIDSGADSHVSRFGKEAARPERSFNDRLRGRETMQRERCLKYRARLCEVRLERFPLIDALGFAHAERMRCLVPPNAQVEPRAGLITASAASFQRPLVGSNER